MRRFVMMAGLLGLLGSWVVMAQEDKKGVRIVSPDSLYLKEDLPEISIVAAKPLIKAEVDKTTYSVAEDPDSKTYTLLEMLRKVPMVTVDGEDNVKVNGSGSFQIYVNGRPSNMFSANPKDILRSIPASTIKKVEVITEPGARYDAEGVSGILNIITKGAEFEGYSANLNSTVSNLFKMVGGFATLKYGRLSLSGNYTYSYYNMKSEVDYLRRQPGATKESDLSMFSAGNVRTPTHYGSVEGSFEIDSLNLFTLSGSMNIGNNRTDWNSRYVMRDFDSKEVYSYNEDKNSENEWGNAAVKVDYQHLFARNKKEMLTLSYQYDYIPKNTFNEFFVKNKTGDLTLPQLESDYIRQGSDARTHEHTIQLDYINPFTDIHSVEGGLKLIRRNNSSQATSEVRDSDTEAWRPAHLQPGVEYRHVQNILSAYTGYSFKWGRWGLTPGIRMEHTWQNVTYKQGLGENFDYRVTDWVPTFASSFRLNDRNQFRVGYNVRIRRPNISYLNPAVTVSGTTLSYGNPGLVSEKQDRITAAYSYFGTKVNLQATLLYTLGRGVISEYMFVDSDGIINSTYDNLVDVKGGGGTLYVSYNPTSQTRISFNGILNHLDLRTLKDNSVYTEEIRNSGFCGSAFLDFSQGFKWGWRLALSGGYLRFEPQMGRDSYAYYFYGLSVVKSFLKDKLTCSLRAQDFVEPYSTTHYTQRYPGFTIQQESRNFGRSLGISISYRFGDLKASVKKANRGILNDDMIKADK